MSVAYAGGVTIGAAGRAAPCRCPSVTKHTVARGDLGARETLDIMARTAREALTDPVVIEAAGRIVRMVPAREFVPQMRALRVWLTQHVKFLRDPVGVELIRTPRYMLDEITRQGIAQGDCDDAAVLGAALGLAIGLPARMVAVGFGGPDARLSHVWTDVKADGMWRELDVTRPIGATAARPSRRILREV